MARERGGSAGFAVGRLRSSFAVAFGLLCLSEIVGASEADPVVDLQALVQETQRASSDPNDMRLVWWMPAEFWRASMTQGEAMPAKQIEALDAALRRYSMFAIVDGTIGPLGGVTYRSAQEVRERVSLLGPDGDRHRPLDPETVNPDVRNLILVMKPIFQSQMGTMGENLHFFVFGTDDGTPILDATREARFSVSVGDLDFDYRLPLGSLLPKAYDRKTGEAFPGNYRYSPFTGRKLTNTPPKESR